MTDTSAQLIAAALNNLAEAIKGHEAGIMERYNDSNESKRQRTVSTAKDLLLRGKGRVYVADRTGLPEWKIRTLQAQMKAEALSALNGGQ